jgi:hypothetical protein
VTNKSAPKVYLKGVARANRRDGGYYWYAWRGGPRLRGEPGSPEFIESYHAAHQAAGRRHAIGIPPDNDKTLGSWSSEDFCLYCGTVIVREGRIRGGRRYCDDDCVREARNKRNRRTGSRPDEVRGHEDIMRLAIELNRPAETLRALAELNDPFYIRPSRIRDAEWFADVWQRFGLGKQRHVHGMHYALVVRTKGEVVMPNGQSYENTRECDNYLARAARDARYLGLIPPESIADHRNSEVKIHHRLHGEPAVGGAEESDVPDFHVPEIDLSFPEPPRLAISKPVIPQRYMVEIWVEKSTQNDILDPLGVQYGVNVFPGLGQSSETRCRELVERAQRAGKPVRILYISDFDPAGDNMPVAAARKIEFWIRMLAPDLDVQVRHVMLTAEQCRRYQLPRKPIKAGERQIPGWESRHGEGATELDALEALYPDEFRRIVVNEIERYFDGSLEARIDEVHANVTAQLESINAEVNTEHESAIASARAAYRDLLDRVNARLRQVEEEFRREFEDLAERENSRARAIAELLDGRSPDLDAVKWPEPVQGDEDPNPLFDSARDYIEQIDRYKQHQGKPTERRRRAKGPG